MAPTHDVQADMNRRRLHRSAALHGLAVVIFGLMTWRSFDLLRAGTQALGVPMLITGVAGATGALVIVASVLRRRAGTAGSHPSGRTQRAARIGMAVAAAAATVVGVALAPAGWERGFVIGVNTVTGGLLAVFALLAGERDTRGQGAA